MPGSEKSSVFMKYFHDEDGFLPSLCIHWMEGKAYKVHRVIGYQRGGERYKSRHDVKRYRK